MIAAECGADAIGLVFVRSSPRFIEPAEAWDIASYLPAFVSSVGLFVNASPKDYHAAKELCPFDYGQLHGQESEPTVRECGPMVIKAIRFDPSTIEAELHRWNRFGEIDAVLVDGSAGGEGATIDWPRLAAAAESSEHPLILAGGLTPDNVGEAIAIVRPWAVDVSSGVESIRGLKDPRLIAAFCDAVRAADADLEATE